jgi:hypothetical protein
MIKLISIAALSIGMATSAMAGGGDAGGAGGGANGMGTHHAYDSLGGTTTNSILSPDQTTTGSINGANAAVGSNSSNAMTSTRTKVRNCNGSASETATGAMTTSACK